MSIRRMRESRGWSQRDLAEASGVPRPTVSAVETGRATPSVSVALALARALATTVEGLFGETGGPDRFATPAGRPPIRYWEAQIGPRRVAFPAEPLLGGALLHDAVLKADGSAERHPAPPTLVIASCDPCLPLLRAPLAARGVRLLALSRPSKEALRLLRDGLVHAAGVHFSNRANPDENRVAVSRMMRGRPQLLVSLHESAAGLITPPALAEVSIEGLIAEHRWVGRSPGSAARALLDRLLDGRERPAGAADEARDARAAAEVVASGAAEVGIGPRVAAEDLGLGFRELERELYELCIPRELASDPPVLALLESLGDLELRRGLGATPGLSTARTGAIIEAS